MRVPPEYQGREQSLLKHRVLHEYLLGWGLKLGSVARGRRARLCYVDGFAGPWKAQSAELDDTSIAIGLNALEEAAQTWREHGVHIDIEAAFVEKDDTAFGDLDRYLKRRTGTVKTFARHGEFGNFVPELQRWLGQDAGLIFVDPTGWKGAAMRFIAPLVKGSRPRDVLVNVMFDHINRFKDDPRTFLREQMRDFFGLGDSELPDRLDEEQLFSLYRTKLKKLCGIPHAADLANPAPDDGANEIPPRRRREGACRPVTVPRHREEGDRRRGGGGSGDRSGSQERRANRPAPSPSSASGHGYPL